MLTFDRLSFWEKELTELSHETEKICILVPSKVNKTVIEEKKEDHARNKNNENVAQESLKQSEKKENGEKQGASVKGGKNTEKNNKKMGKKEGANQVKLSKKVGELGMKMVK